MRWIKGILMLLRILPVLSWSMSGILLGLSVVVYVQGWRGVNLLHLFLVLLSAILLQGIIAHAYNDIKDWQSGTDQFSPGILSGGSGVLKRFLFRERDLTLIGICSILVVLVIATYFVLVTGLTVLLFLGVGLWAALAYSCSPFRLAYRPWLGEWLCAWPSMIVLTTGTSYILSNGQWYLESLVLGMLHATLSITWLMLHHIPDIAADLQADPVKLTSIAYMWLQEGWKGVRVIVGTYLFIAFIIAVWGSYLLQRLEIGLISGLLIGISYWVVKQIRLEQVELVTVVELLMIFGTIVNAVGISWILMMN